MIFEKYVCLKRKYFIGDQNHLAETKSPKNRNSLSRDNLFAKDEKFAHTGCNNTTTAKASCHPLDVMELKLII